MRRLALALALSALPGAVVLAQDVAATLADTVRGGNDLGARVAAVAHGVGERGGHVLGQDRGAGQGAQGQR